MSANAGVWKGFRQQRPGSGANELAEKATAASTKHSEPAVGLAEDQGLDLEEAEASLRQFDMASKYGPCRGISRLERWAWELVVTPEYRMKLFINELKECIVTHTHHIAAYPLLFCCWAPILRWERAAEMGLEPPPAVRALLARPGVGQASCFDW